MPAPLLKVQTPVAGSVDTTIKSATAPGVTVHVTLVTVALVASVARTVRLPVSASSHIPIKFASEFPAAEVYASPVAAAGSAARDTLIVISVAALAYTALAVPAVAE